MMMKFARNAAICAAILTSLTAIRVSAQTPVPDMATDRPDFTEGASIVRRLQIESGYTFARTDGTDSHSIGEVLARIGLAPRAELRVGLNSYGLTRARSGSGQHEGFEDVSLGVKLRLQDNAPTSVIIAAGLPTGNAPGHGEGLAPEIVFLMEPSLGSDRFALGLNAGFVSEPDPFARTLSMLASAAFGADMSSRTGVFLEMYGTRRLSGGLETPGVESSDGRIFVDAGLTHLLTADLQLDLRIGHSLVNQKENYIGVGLSRRFR